MVFQVKGPFIINTGGGGWLEKRGGYIFLNIIFGGMQ
jgi:hypothetical protein